MVLENLLMNYENNQLPTHGKGKETTLRLSTRLRFNTVIIYTV